MSGRSLIKHTAKEGQGEETTHDRRRGARIRLSLLLAVAALVASPPASALQPLTDFVEGARAKNLDTAAARATVAQRAREADQAWARLGPTLTGRASYTRNQYEAIVTLPPMGGSPARTATFTTYDQWDATATVDLPLVDLGSWSRIGAAQATLRSAQADLIASRDDVEKVVCQTYTRIVATEALLRASLEEVEVAEANLAVVRTRHAAGTASDLDVERASAEVARTRQDVADSAKTVATSRNALLSLTGMVPSDGAPPLADDLHAEPGLESFLPGASSVGAVRAAHASALAAARNERAAYDGLLPTLSATATERATNAVGFGTSPYWAAGFYVQIKLDVATMEGARASATASEVARIRAAKANQDARDAVFNAWHDVSADIAKSAAARAQQTASVHAAGLARTRYAAGTGTQLEVIQADRDAFSAEVARIQADADLVYARVLLHITSGQPAELGGGE